MENKLLLGKDRPRGDYEMLLDGTLREGMTVEQKQLSLQVLILKVLLDIRDNMGYEDKERKTSDLG